MRWLFYFFPELENFNSKYSNRLLDEAHYLFT
jgi:hypothetical protein